MAHGSAQPGYSDESPLIARAKAGDHAAFAELVSRYERKIFRLAKHITQNEEDAEDVLQDAFLKAYEHLGDFQEQSRFYTWLVRIAVNESLMRLRKRRQGKIVSLDEGVDAGGEMIPREIAVWDGDPEQRYSREELREILQRAIESLAPIYRVVFVLRDVDELSTEETAQALNISAPAVKSRLLRARLELREKLTRFFKRKADDVYAHM